MVHYNNHCILRRIDLDDIESIQNVMGALASSLASSSTEFRYTLDGTVPLTQLERLWIKSIISAMNRNTKYTLLTQAIARFCGARLKPPAQLREAAKELECLATEYVLRIPEMHTEKYTAALERFAALPPTDILAMRRMAKRLDQVKIKSTRASNITDGVKDRAPGATQLPTKRGRGTQLEEEALGEPDKKKAKLKAGQETTRAKSACTMCRHSKIRCDALDSLPSPCSNCRKGGKECVLSTLPTAKESKKRNS